MFIESKVINCLAIQHENEKLTADQLNKYLLFHVTLSRDTWTKYEQKYSDTEYQIVQTVGFYSLRERERARIGADRRSTGRPKLTRPLAWHLLPLAGLQLRHLSAPSSVRYRPTFSSYHTPRPRRPSFSMPGSGFPWQPASAYSCTPRRHGRHQSRGRQQQATLAA